MSALYLSAFTFGGGYVIVTLMKQKFVDELHWIEEDEMLDLVAIAQSAPGAIAVNGAIVVGYTLTIDYNTNGMPDYTADQMYASAKENGTEYGGMDTMPDIVGLGLWKQGHWGVYVGNGYAIEAMGTQYGVVRTKVEGRGWQGWCKIPYIQYDE